MAGSARFYTLKALDSGSILIFIEGNGTLDIPALETKCDIWSGLVMFISAFNEVNMSTYPRSVGATATPRDLVMFRAYCSLWVANIWTKYWQIIGGYGWSTGVGKFNFFGTQQLMSLISLESFLFITHHVPPTICGVELANIRNTTLRIWYCATGVYNKFPFCCCHNSVLDESNQPLSKHEMSKFHSCVWKK